MTETLLLHDLPRGGVVVGVDGSDGSDEAVDRAADAAARQHRQLVVVHTDLSGRRSPTGTVTTEITLRKPGSQGA